MALLVIAHFGASLLATLPARSPISSLPGVPMLRAFYRTHNLGQSWVMFAPPPTQRLTLEVALRFPEGWTGLVRLDEFTPARLAGVLIQPRGLFRVRAFLSASNEDRMSAGALDPRSSRAFFYQQLAEFFCRGDGRPEDVLTVRLYLVGRSPPHFHSADADGHPLPPPAQWDFQQPLYEQECAA